MRVALFDMDGTLTPPRKKLDSAMIKPLADLQQSGFKLGIISGSDIDYIDEQCKLLGEFNQVDPFDIMYFPCNGTKRYTLKNSSYNLDYSLDMRAHMGKEKYNDQ